MLINKIGDLSLLVSIALTQYYFGTTQIAVLERNFLSLSSAPTYSIFGFGFSVIDLIVCFLFIGVIAKSAQLGLHMWLPDAMEGPTPVSALIHAATMVTAGVLLLIKMFFFIQTSSMGSIMVYSGLITSLFAGVVALVQHDIKKVIAYSTCSQLGLMVLSCGLGFFGFAFFHLITHAFFKALLFLCAGSVVHSLGDEQDIRRMGGLQRVLPITNAAFLIGNLAIAGLPFFSGFYSKELLLFASLTYSPTLYFLSCIATSLTTIYSIRLYSLVMLGYYSGYVGRIMILSEAGQGVKLRSVLFLLSLLSIMSGFFLRPIFTVNQTLAASQQNFDFVGIVILVDDMFSKTENFATLTKLTPLILATFFLAIYVILTTYLRTQTHSIRYFMQAKRSQIYHLLIKKFFFDNLLGILSMRILFFAGGAYWLIDKGVLSRGLGSGVAGCAWRIARFLFTPPALINLGGAYLIII